MTKGQLQDALGLFEGDFKNLGEIMVDLRDLAADINEDYDG